LSSKVSSRRVLVTRAAHQVGKLSEALREHGLVPVEVPVLEIRPPESFGSLDRALNQLATYDWLIFTSANTVRVLADRATDIKLNFANLTTQVAAVGEATAAQARSTGFTVSVVPDNYVAESLISYLRDQVAGKRVLLARAAVARNVIPDALRAAGAELDVVDAYRNVVPAAAASQLRQALAEGIAAATFTSSSSVTHLADAAKQAGVAFPFPGVAAVSIGLITSQTLREHKWEPAAEASQSGIPSLAAAVAHLLR